MSIFINNIKRIIRDKGNIITMILTPLIFIMFTMGTGNINRLNAAVIDKDNTSLSKMIVNMISSNVNLKDIKEEEISGKLLNEQIDYALVIDKGFTEKIIKGEDVKLKGYKIKETNASAPLNIYINSFVSSIKNIAKSCGGDSKKFYKALEYYEDGSFKAEFKPLGNRKRVLTYSSLGFVVMGMLIFSLTSSNLSLEDKRNKTFYRVFSAPVSTKSYMFQNILSYYVLSIFQTIILFLFMIEVLGADFGPNIKSIFMLFSAFSLAAVTLGFLISSISKDGSQAGAITALVITPMCMLGGCFWPREIMPKFLIEISNFVPTTWVLKGAKKAFFSTGIWDIKYELIILLLFATTFFLLGIIKKADIDK